MPPRPAGVSVSGDDVNDVPVLRAEKRVSGPRRPDTLNDRSMQDSEMLETVEDQVEAEREFDVVIARTQPTLVADRLRESAMLG